MKFGRVVDIQWFALQEILNNSFFSKIQENKEATIFNNQCTKEEQGLSKVSPSFEEIYRISNQSRASAEGKSV